MNEITSRIHFMQMTINSVVILEFSIAGQNWARIFVTHLKSNRGEKVTYRTVKYEYDIEMSE